MIDNCKGCDVPERAERTNPFDYDDYFSCSDCACHRCEHLHSCKGQCAQDREGSD